MNLIEALRLKAPLRRPISAHLGSAGDGWLGHNYILDILCSYPGKSNATYTFILSDYDILADDWEVKEKEITLTKSLFLKILHQTLLEISKENKHIIPLSP